LRVLLPCRLSNLAGWFCDRRNAEKQPLRRCFPFPALRSGSRPGRRSPPSHPPHDHHIRSQRFYHIP
jgi:hypothetical protein